MTEAIQSVLKDLEHILCGERQEQYGKPENSLQRIADYWNIYLAHKGLEIKLDALDVGQMMVLLKIGRNEYSNKYDNFLDEAGYAILLGSLLKEEYLIKNVEYQFSSEKP